MTAAELTSTCRIRGNCSSHCSVTCVMSRSAASPRPRHPPLGCSRVLASLHTYTAQPGLDTTSNTLHTSILYRHMSRGLDTTSNTPHVDTATLYRHVSRGLVTTSNTPHVDTAYIPLLYIVLHRLLHKSRGLDTTSNTKHQTRGRACPQYIINTA